MKVASPPPVGSRPGLCDFVPSEGRLFSFAVRDNPQIQRLAEALRNAGIESLLDPSRFLALSMLIRSAVENSSGDLIELGVYKGGSAALAALVLRAAGLTRPLHLCDTFEGMPKTLDWEFHKEFDFADTSLESVSARLAKLDPQFPFHFHRGLFSETLPHLAALRFCFAHVDADLYESVRQACEFVYPRMEKGGFIIFDDYGASTCPGAKKAVDEFFADKLEKPCHVASCAYGVRIGSARMDFPSVILRRSLLPALLNAARNAPRQQAGRAFLAACERVASPRTTRMLSAPFLRRSAAATSVKDARSILVVRTDSIGDLILMSPFLRELRRSNAAAWISLVVDRRFMNLVETCPYVNEVLPFDLGNQGRTGSLALHRRALRLGRTRFWKRAFDLALLPRWDVDYYHAAFIALFSRARERVGYTEKVSQLKARLNRDYDGLFTRKLNGQEAKHEVEHNLDFLRAVGGTIRDDSLELWLTPEDREVAQARLSSNGVDSSDLLIGLAPGAGYPRRLWPIGRFIELGRYLQREHAARLLIVGGPEDRERGERLKKELGAAAINFAGETTLRQTAALLEHTRLVVANDSGPMHVAAAAGAAVVEISCHPATGEHNHSNSPTRFRPWTEEYAVLQPPGASTPCEAGCEWHEAHCILNVSCDIVKEAVTSILERAPERHLHRQASSLHG